MQRSIGVLIVLLGLCAHAYADADADRAAKADAVFAEALELKKAGKADEACKKFHEALDYNPNAIGAILNVALCYEQSGRVASAAKLFAEARDRAREQNLNDKNLAAAEEHLAKNEPLVPHVSIAFAESPTTDTRLVVDDQIIPVNQANDVPIDPGTRTITVSAPGRVSYETKLEIKEKERKAVAIPRLGHQVVINKTRRTVGKVVLGVGLAAFVTSEVIAYSAHKDYDSAIKACTGTACPSEQYTTTRNAYSLGNVATGIGVAGGAVALVGAYLWFFAPKEEAPPPHQVTLVPSFDGSQAGVAAVGRF